MELNLVREFVYTLVLQNFIVIDSTFTCMWESRTRREAEEACLALNYSLIHVTPYVRELIENEWRAWSRNVNSTLPYSVEFWANHSPDDSRSKGQIQYDMFPPTYDPSDLCVKIVYEVNNTRFGWVPVDCENKTAKAYTCCNQGVLHRDHYKALLLLKRYNCYAVDQICKQEGGTLFDLRSKEMEFMKQFFDNPPWGEENVTEVWSALSVNELQDNEMCTLSRIIRPQPGVLRIESHLDSCEKKYMAICMKPTGRQMFYTHRKNIFVKENNCFLNTTSIEKTTTDCMEECDGLNKVGVACMGFNFHTRSFTCRFFEECNKFLYSPDPSLSIEVYYLVPVTPLIYSEETITKLSHNTTDFSSIAPDKTQQHHTSALIHVYSEETITKLSQYTTDFSSIAPDKTQQHHTSGIIVINVAACLASIASVVVLSSIVGRILSILNKNMFQTEQRQACPLENEIEIPSYHDDECLNSTNIIHSLPPVSYEGTIY